MKRNKTGGSPVPEKSFAKRVKHWFMPKANQKQSVTKEPRKPVCLFCEKDYWGDTCTEYDTLEKRKNYFVEHKLCFNCGKIGHMANKCRSRGCYKCKAKHHTNLCDAQSLTSDVTNVVTGYTPSVDTCYCASKNLGCYFLDLLRQALAENLYQPMQLKGWI